MSIDTGVPVSVKRPGAFHKFLFSTAGRGLIPLEIAIGLVGMKSSAGSATAETPVEVFDEADADSKFGTGSELALMCRKAFEQASLQDAQPRIFGCPIAEPGASVANAQTLTVSGPATADGNLELRVAGRPIVVGVANGDAATAIAANLEKELDAKASELPVTASVAGAVVTITHVTTGTNGSQVVVNVDKKPAGVGVVVATSAAGTGTTDITNALDAMLDRDYDGIAVANFASADVTDAKAHTASAWGINEKKYRHIFIGHRGTLSAAQTLATASNDYTVVIASYEGSPSLPGEIAAAVCCYVFGKTRPNANYDFGEVVLYPPAATDVFKATEIESALSGGLTPLRPTTEGDSSEIVRLVTTKVTTSSAPDFATFDLATTRTAAFMARQVDARYVTEFKQELLVTDEEAPENVLKRVRDMVVGIHEALQDDRVLRDLDEFLPMIDVQENATVAGRLDCVNPFRVVSPLHQGAFVHHAYI